MSEEKKQKDGQATKAIIVLGIALVIGAVVLTVVFVGMIFGDKKTEESTLAYELTSRQPTAAQESNNSGPLLSTTEGSGNGDAQGTTNKVEEAGDDVVTTDSATNNSESTKNQAIEYYEQLSPNGDNILSDNFENEYIKLISDNYDVDPDLLVAIYSTPDTGNNFVLQFSGKKHLNGNYVKSPDELVKVYQIDKQKNVKIATGQETGNVGVSYAEGMLCFHMVKTIVMEQYPDYFTGLEK